MRWSCGRSDKAVGRGLSKSESRAGHLASFGDDLTVAVIGATGGIGRALAARLEASSNVKTLFVLSRSGENPAEAPSAAAMPLDLLDETSIEQAATEIEKRPDTLDLILVATGILHDGADLQPERSWKSLSADALARAFAINTTGPALVAKHFLPVLPRDRRCAFAAISARIGSIEDNALGGWHSYRASKAALNMLIRNFAIELGRRNPDALCVGLHPGTVDTVLSQPFQRGVPSDRLFTPDRSARALLDVVDGLSPGDTGGLFAWDGARIPF